jgi:hypothetical protein
VTRHHPIDTTAAGLIRKLRDGATLVWPLNMTRPLLRRADVGIASYVRGYIVKSVETAGMLRMGHRLDRFDTRIFELTS